MESSTSENKTKVCLFEEMELWTILLYRFTNVIFTKTADRAFHLKSDQLKQRKLYLYRHCGSGTEAGFRKAFPL